MRIRRLTTLLLATAALGLASPITPRSPAAMTTAAIHHSAATTAPAENVAGGRWRPLSVQGCALSLGAFVGALVTTGPFAPIVGSVALHAALFTCF